MMTRKKQATTPTHTVGEYTIKQMSGVGYGQPWPALWIPHSGIDNVRAPRLGHTVMQDSLN